jgi:hypothetical protein
MFSRPILTNNWWQIGNDIFDDYADQQQLLRELNDEPLPTTENYMFSLFTYVDLGDVCF